MINSQTRSFLISVVFLVGLGGFEGVSLAEEKLTFPKNEWGFKKFFGTYDRAALQRGFQVYKEVCSACHGMDHLYYRNLEALGFTGAQVKTIARDYKIPSIDDQGQSFERPAEPSDRFVAPFPNELAARAANNGAYPPDLSLIVKARAGGPDYIKALLLGFKAAPEGFKLYPGMHYNAYFSGHQIAMAPPLTEGQVTYADGTKATVEQMVDDVVTFMAWAAEPELEVRKKLGIRVMLFLSVFAVFMFFVLRQAKKAIK
jgi:ubiquinol-cytochrome c reductase cytochrome c1 subunit